ncbi:glycosyltransferase [Ilyobacter polytropus]|uniref:Glycosyl transferase group 1 n=1 Tax=Ilyobacter polytropus (strain ATCC 51220 / DSM 2926 / LMG 16218 / CuHBu1) TaxID=572544 RepID=E3HB30_ILYPC|nr:glycosyltransferase [Ilyobacter polytropus]ADO82179.1 glycosyl transferase group 1 [Ilyobacter polytropus DSM 2926]
MRLMLLTIREHPGTQGGIQTFLRTLKKYFNEDAFFVTTVIPKKEDILFNIIDLKNISAFQNNKYFHLIGRTFSKISREAFKKDVLNLIYKKQLKSFDGISILASPKDIKIVNKKCKKILVQHTNVSNLIKSKSNFFNSNKLIEKAEKELDVFVALSPKDKELIENTFKLEKGKVVCIRHSCELPLLEEKKEKSKNLIMISRLDNTSKRFDLAMKAMKKLPNYNLNIYGDGKDRKILETLRAKLALKNVIFHGKTNKVKEKLDENGIFIMTSDYEGYGITNIEAMRRGLPIILRDTYEAASDIVQGNGVLLEKEWNEDKFVKAVYEVYKNYEEYSLKSIELGKRHNPKTIKVHWEKLFEELTNSFRECQGEEGVI